MHDLGWLALAILAAYGCAILAPSWPFWLGRRAGAFVGACIAPLILAFPLLIPPSKVGLRAGAMFVAGELFFKMIEALRHERRGAEPLSLRDYYAFLVPLPVLAAVYPDHKRRLTQRENPIPNLLRLVGGGVGAAVAVFALLASSKLDAIRASFTLNHVAMLLAFTLAISSISRALHGLERLAGFDTRPIISHAFLSRSVAEFWQRYNYRIHDWIYQNVFLQVGGRRHPARGVLLAFFVSGVFHELTFALATSRWTGYQLAFFTLQGPAAIATGHLAKSAGVAGRIAARACTLFFLALTSVLFFDGVASIFPFIYVSRSPLPW